MNNKRSLTSAGSFLARTVPMLIIALVGLSRNAFAQYPPDHDFHRTRPCEISATVAINNGPPGSSGGSMGMDVVASSVAGEAPPWQVLRAFSFHSTGFDPAVGSVSWDLDATRQAPDTRIQGNNADGSLFPATCDIYFYVTATCSNFPTMLFRSINPVHMQSTGLMSFSPHNNETYNSVGTVDFEDANAPGPIVFTVTSLTSILN